MSRRLIAVIFACVAALVLVLVAAPHFWPAGSFGITWHGWAAYIIGTALTLALSGGLFYLSFYPSRSGHDDIDRPDDTGR